MFLNCHLTASSNEREWRMIKNFKNKSNHWKWVIRCDDGNQQYEWIHRFAANYLSSIGIKLVSVGFVFDHQLFNSGIHMLKSLFVCISILWMRQRIGLSWHSREKTEREKEKRTGRVNNRGKQPARGEKKCKEKDFRIVTGKR